LKKESVTGSTGSVTFEGFADGGSTVAKTILGDTLFFNKVVYFDRTGDGQVGFSNSNGCPSKYIEIFWCGSQP
jgi:hypothetical protein